VTVPSAATETVRLRISDAERERVADFLREHCGDGRLTPTELEERIDAVHEARTMPELEPLVRDLPGAADAVPSLRSLPRPAWLVRSPRPSRTAPALLVGGGLIAAAFAAPVLFWVALALTIAAAATLFGLALAAAPVLLVVAAVVFAVRGLSRRLEPRSAR